jgi:hypothetical protein
VDAALAAADEYERELQRAILKAFRETQEAANVTKFLEAMKRNDVTGAMAALKIYSLRERLGG